MTINEKNIQGATITLVGYAAGEARTPAYDRGGTRGILELSIPINEGYKKDGEFVQTGVTWYSVTAAGEHADALRGIGKGDKVRVDNAKQEVREYKDKEGNTKLGINLVFGVVTILESKSGAAPAGEDTPW